MSGQGLRNTETQRIDAQDALHYVIVNDFHSNLLAACNAFLVLRLLKAGNGSEGRPGSSSTVHNELSCKLHDCREGELGSG